MASNVDPRFSEVPKEHDVLGGKEKTAEDKQKSSLGNLFSKKKASHQEVGTIIASGNRQVKELESSPVQVSPIVKEQPSLYELKRAVEKGESTEVAGLLRAKAWGDELNKPVFGENGLLWIATVKGHKEVSHLLREYGAKLETQSMRQYKAEISFPLPHITPASIDELLSTCQYLERMARKPALNTADAWAILGFLELLRKNSPGEATGSGWPPKVSELHQLAQILWNTINLCEDAIALHWKRKP